MPILVCPGCGESDRVTDVGDRDGYWYDYHCARCGRGWD